MPAARMKRMKIGVIRYAEKKERNEAAARE